MQGEGVADNKPITFRGKRFASQAKLARFHSVTPQNLHKRLRRGWTLEEALGIKKGPPRKASRRKHIVFRGMEFESHKSLAEHYGQSDTNLCNRLKLGWTLEQALGLKRKERAAHQGNHKPVTVQGKNGKEFYSSFKVACRKYKVDYRTATARRYGGWTVEQALEIVPLPSHTYEGLGAIYVITNKKIAKQYVGQTMHRIETRWKGHVEGASNGSQMPIAKAIRKFGAESFEMRVLETANTRDELNRRERHWIEKLGTLAPHGYNQSRGGSGHTKGKEVVVDGRKYKSFSDCAFQHGICKSLVTARLKKGWSVERAFTTPSGLNRKEVRVAGMVFVSMAEAARFHGVTPKLFHKRLTIYGWSLEKALGIKQKEE